MSSGYMGPLTRDQFIDGFDKTLKNAEDLLNEAQILYDANKPARAWFLLCICNEELGKALMITNALADYVAGTINWRMFWNDFRSHKAKSWRVEHMKNLFVYSEQSIVSPGVVNEMVTAIDEIKKASLYVDVFDDEFLDPSELIDAETVEAALALTKKGVDFAKSTRPARSALESLSKEYVVKLRSEYGIKIPMPAKRLKNSKAARDNDK